jgi:transcriptional regulator with XRE-family HTH domain
MLRHMQLPYRALTSFACLGPNNWQLIAVTFNGAIVSAPGSTRLQQDAARRTRSIVRSVGETLRASRQDAGLSQRQVAIAAGLSQPHLSALEAGMLEPSLGALVALSLALGGEMSLRFFPGTGPVLRDRIQGINGRGAPLNRRLALVVFSGGPGSSTGLRRH